MCDDIGSNPNLDDFPSIKPRLGQQMHSYVWVHDQEWGSPTPARSNLCTVVLTRLMVLKFNPIRT